MKISIVKAKSEQDIIDAYALIKELAIYENAPDAVTNPVSLFIEHGLGENPIYKLWLAKHENKTIGMALCFTAYSTWKGKMLYLDDLVVTEAYRRKGIGKLLLNALTLHAKNEAYKLIKWQVLDWNLPAISFYEKFDVTIDKEWYDCKLYEKDYDLFLSK